MRGLLGSLLACRVAGQMYFPPWEEVQDFMTQVVVKGAPEPEVAPDFNDHAKFTHPKICDPKVNQTAGYLRASSSSKYFFWLFESRHSPSTDPLVVWLSGGPGCSSQLALFKENGPCFVDKRGKTVVNDFSWNERANLLFLDQPAGVGFTTGFGTQNEDGVAERGYTFFQGFFEKFPQYQKVPFYIFGESYAGHYIPAIGYRITKGNLNKEGIHIPLHGVGIGNGMVNPEEQYKHYAEFVLDGGRSRGGSLKQGVATKDSEMYKDMQDSILPCTTAIRACNYCVGSCKACLVAYHVCANGMIAPYRAKGLNPYDVRAPCKGNLCYDFDHISAYLNSPEVQKELGTQKHWRTCDFNVTMTFIVAGDNMKNFHQFIPPMLENGVEVLNFAGDTDFICNWIGNKEWALKLKWAHQKEFNEAADMDFLVDGVSAGRSRSYAGFTFTQVYNAGHMVPMDQPAAALALLNRFIHHDALPPARSKFLAAGQDRLLKL